MVGMGISTKGTKLHKDRPNPNSLPRVRGDKGIHKGCPYGVIGIYEMACKDLDRDA